MDSSTGHSRILPNRLHLVLVAMCLAVLSVASVAFTSLKDGWDNSWYAHTTVSLLREGNLSIDEYEGQIAQRRGFGIRRIDDVPYNFFPIGPSLVAVPIVAPLLFLFGDDPVTFRAILPIPIAAGIVVGFFTLLWRLTHRLTPSICLTLLAWFGTTNLTTLAGGAWSHGSAELLLLLIAITALSEKEKESNGRRICRWVFCGICVTLVYLCRPPGLLLALPVFYWSWHRGRTNAIIAALSAIVAACAFMVFSQSMIGQILPPYYAAGRLTLKGLPDGLSGQLISPNRGLFWFFPVSLLSLVGAIRAVSRRDVILLPIAISSVAFCAAVACFPHWWGGWSYGPRLHTDMIPWMILLLLPIIEPVATAQRQIVVFAVLAAIALAIQMRGYCSTAPWNWNEFPIDVDEDPARLWDFSRLQIIGVEKPMELDGGEISQGAP